MALITNLLERVPLLGTAAAWVGSKARLLLEYGLIASVVALAGFAFNSTLQRKALEKTVTGLSTSLGSVATTLNQQVEANHQQDAAIQRLKDLRELDSSALSTLQGELGSVNANNRTIKTKLAELERTNAQAKAFLDIAVPDAVGCLLDGRPCQAADADSHHGNAH